MKKIKDFFKRLFSNIDYNDDSTPPEDRAW